MKRCVARYNLGCRCPKCHFDTSDLVFLGPRPKWQDDLIIELHHLAQSDEERKRNAARLLHRLGR